MLGPSSSAKIYLCTGFTDMRKGLHSLMLLANSLLESQVTSGAAFIFRGKNAKKIKILWWDQQGFCLFHKCFESGRFIWPNTKESSTLGITRAQLSMLLEGINWGSPEWTSAPKYIA
jgi:transposase